MLKRVELEAFGLLLRPWGESDADLDAALRGMTDPAFRRWNTPLEPVTDEVSARRFLRGRSDDWDRGDMASYAITEDGAVLGHVGIAVIDFHLRNARVGYWLLPEARGQGAASRALEAVSRWAFRDLGLHRLELGHGLGNDPSCAVAGRCGYAYEGVLRGAMVDETGTPQDLHLHARVATDPLPKGSAR